MVKMTNCQKNRKKKTLCHLGHCVDCLVAQKKKKKKKKNGGSVLVSSQSSYLGL